MKINATLSISFTSNRKVNIRLRDKNSRVRFFEGSMEYEEFTAALSSLAECPFIEAETYRLDAIGKRFERQDVSIVCPFESHDRKKLEAWLRDNAKHPGWEVDAYLGSQSSVSYDGDNGCVLRYSIFRYVDGEE